MFSGPGVVQARSPVGDTATARRERPPKGQGRSFSSRGWSLRFSVPRACGGDFPRRASEGSETEAVPRPGTLLRALGSYYCRGECVPGFRGRALYGRRPQIFSGGCSHGTLRGGAEVAALGSLWESLVKGPGGLPLHSLQPAFSPLPQASAGASQEQAASSGAAGQRGSGLQCGETLADSGDARYQH